MKFLRYRGVLLLVILLSACESPTPVKPEPLAPVPAPSQHQRQQALIADLLYAGDRALAADRLLQPLDDNAYDRFRAVLLLDPGNAVARSGLQAIVLRYLDLARMAAARSEYTQALSHTGLAEEIDPGNPLVEELRDSIRQQMHHHHRAVADRDAEHHLDPQMLSRRGEAMVALLGEIAREVRTSGDFILIVARNDAEGRWIYQQMREAVPDFLLRGDIIIGAPPRIQRLPPN
jgi:hypothetical protein